MTAWRWVKNPKGEYVVEALGVKPVTPEVTEGMDIPDLDAQVRTITPPKKGETDWIVEIGLQESLGESGGDIVTWTYTSKPTMAEIRSDILREYRDTKANINKEVAMGITAKSGRDEAIERAIDKVLKQPVISEAGMPAKEAWEMTKEEFITEADKQPIHPFFGVHNDKWRADGLRVHKRSVEVALEQDKPVPPEVLAEYPGLKIIRR